MFRFAIKRSTKTVVERFSLSALIWSVLLCGAMLSPLSLAKGQASVSNTANRPDPDILLINVYKDLAANHLKAALLKADALVAAYPNFRLGHLIRGDLLLMHTRPITSLGGASNAPADKLKDLRDEAAVRLKSLSKKPDADMIPRALLQLREDQKFVLLVDAKQSRLYVYQHQNGRFKFMTDYYVSQGKLGVNKLKAGDQKTPLGVYYITSTGTLDYSCQNVGTPQCGGSTLAAIRVGSPSQTASISIGGSTSGPTQINKTQSSAGHQPPYKNWNNSRNQRQAEEHYEKLVCERGWG